MKTAILFSGGKDSCLALHHALKSSDVRCLVTVVSENPESYMFHTPNIGIAEKQAGAIGLPIIIMKSKGEKEKELKDLENAMIRAKREYEIEGIYTGALASVYQASRIQAICDKLSLKCINPLWQKDQLEELEELVRLKFEVIIIGVFGLGLEGFIGRKIDRKFIDDIKKVKYQINPAGEGGEFESLTLDGPYFRKRIEILASHIENDAQGGRVMMIDAIELRQK